MTSVECIPKNSSLSPIPDDSEPFLNSVHDFTELRAILQHFETI